MRLCAQMLTKPGTRLIRIARPFPTENDSAFVIISFGQGELGASLRSRSRIVGSNVLSQPFGVDVCERGLAEV